MIHAEKLMIGMFALSVSAAQAVLAGSVPKETPEFIAKGKEVYMTNCLTCHGDKADGNGPAGQYMNPKPRDLTAPATFKRSSGVEAVFKTISEGLPGTSMVGFSAISEAERWALVHYVRSLFKGGAKKANGK